MELKMIEASTDRKISQTGLWELFLLEHGINLTAQL
jgi:hypothetical protein